MKKFYVAFLGLTLGLAACSDMEQDEIAPDSEKLESPELKNVEPDENLFPVENGEKDLSTYNLSQQIYYLLRQAPDTLGASMGNVKVSAEEYAEIKDETEYIIEGKTTDLAKYQAIFAWIRANVGYDNNGENQEQSAYYAFINKKANCQGYSNLMNVMTHCAGLRSFNVNGYLVSGGAGLGHAWTYVHCGTSWRVCDVTNNQEWAITSHASYNDKLIPFSIDVPLNADEHFVYGWFDRTFAVIGVKPTANTQLTVPYGAGGCRVGTFNPQGKLPESVKEIYFGKNIESIGESYNMGLSIYGSDNLTAIHVDPANTKLKSHKGMLYRVFGGQPQLYFIPLGATYVELLPEIGEVGKNDIAHHKKVKTIYFPAGITKIYPYAVEDCPNLQAIYVPEDVKFCDFDNNEYDNPLTTTFVSIPRNCQIIRGAVPTGIRNITL